MAAAFSAAALLYLACLPVGAAALRACRRPAGTGYGAAVGLAVLLVAASLAIKLPGDAATAAALLGLLIVASAVYARGELLRAPSVPVVVATVVLALALTIPFVVAGGVGIPGTGVNYDMSNHIAWAEALRTEGIDRPLPLPVGYPLGAHALVATVAEVLGTDTARAFVGLLMAIPLLTLLAALPLLDAIGRGWRELAALLVALPYMMAAYYGQGSFKETLQALFVVAFVALLREMVRQRAVDVGRLLLIAVVLLGAFFNYSYLGLSWQVAALAVWLPLELMLGGGWLRPLKALGRGWAKVTASRRTALLALVGVAAVIAPALPELSRASDFFQEISFSPSGTGTISTSEFGNLGEALSPFQALGTWPNDNFRDYFDAPRDAYKAGLAGGVGILALLFGGVWWVGRRDLVAPAAAVGAAAIYLYLKPNESPYVTAKALAVLAPLVMVVAVGGLLGRRNEADRELRLFRIGLTVAFVGLALASSFLALRGSWVGPTEHERELDGIRPIVRGSTVLFLPIDFFANWELRGAYVTGIVIPHPIRVDVRPEKVAGKGRPYDFDWVTSATLDRFAFVVSPRSAYRSEPPANFRLIKTTASYELWKRSGPTPERQVLPGEGADPGSVLDCASRADRQLSRRTGWARVREKPALAVGPPGRAVRRGNRQTLDPGESVIRRLVLSPGRYELSLVFTASRGPEIEPPRPAARPAPQLDLAGPFWRAAEIDWPGGPLEARVRAAAMPLGAQTQVTDVGELAAVRSDREPELVPLREACGRYVDWYTLGSAPPPLPRARH